MTKLSAFFIFSVTLWLTGCRAEDQELNLTGTTGAPINVNNPSQTFDPVGQTLLAQGTFAGSGSYRVSGTRCTRKLANGRSFLKTSAVAPALIFASI